MLLNMKDLLKVAYDNKFTIGAFNCTDLSNFKCVYETAEKLQAPTIIAVTGAELEFGGENYFTFIREKLMGSKIPYVLHLDHGKNLKECIRAIQCGFTSVMIDASHLPYEENVKTTKEVCDIAHLVNVSVEGELGTIGTTGLSDEDGTNIIYTQPEEVVDFVAKTGVDSLAIAIGTSHGLYPEGFKPVLQLELLKKIREVSDIPLVLHGGSGQDDEQIRQASKIGIQKINVASEFKAAESYALAKLVNETKQFKFVSLMPEAMKPAKEVIEHKMDVFGCIDKAYLYYSDLRKGE